MDRTAALKLFEILPASTSDEIISAIEDKLFAMKNEVLLKYMVPKLLNKKTDQLALIIAAEAQLNPIVLKPKPHDNYAWTNQPENRIEFLEQYESNLSALKLGVMNCISFQELNDLIRSLILTQEYYMVLFKIMFNEFSEALPEEVNTRDMIDTGKLLLSMKNGDPDDKQTWEIEREIARIEKIQRLYN